MLGTYRHITAPECRQYLLRQAFEEADPPACFVVMRSLGPDEAEIFNVPRDQMHPRPDEFLIPFIGVAAFNPELRTGDFESDQKLLKSHIVFGFAS